MSTTESRPGMAVAHEALDWGRRTIEPALAAALDTLPQDMRHVARYHFGWTNEDGEPVEASRGKALRPTLVLLAARAVGAQATEAIPAAVAVELVHNFSLLHDDVMDGDTHRRHHRTAWTVFGTDAAVLAGDALLSLATDVLAASDHPAALAATRRLNRAVQHLIEGQIMDVAFERRTDVTLAECQRMSEAKTGALLGTACDLGATFGAGTIDEVADLCSFGQQLGMAFQHTDDLLGIWGDPGVTGKAAYSDLHRRKKTLPIVAALTSHTAAGDTFATRYFRDDVLAEADLAELATLVDTAGGRTWSHTQVDELLQHALRHLRALTADDSRAALMALAHLVADREH